MREIEGPPPEHLRERWTQDLWCLHSANRWRRHWERTGIVEVQIADSMSDGWKVWLDWYNVIAPENQVEINALQADRGTYLGYIRCIGRHQCHVKLADEILSLPTQYTKKPLLRT